MATIISVHSFRGGTGKSNTTANIATLMALQGKRVGVVDTDIQSPGIHILFGLGEDQMKPTLNDYLWGLCGIEQTAHDIGETLAKNNNAQAARIGRGQLYLIPSSMKPAEIARVLRERYDVELLNDGFHTLIEQLALDVLLVDTHPGLNDETLLSIAVSDSLIILLRPDQQDFQGTKVTVEVARKLDVARMLLVINKVPSVFDPADIKATVEKTYGCPVVAVIPHDEEVMALGSAGMFVLQHPDHAISQKLKQIVSALLTE